VIPGRDPSLADVLFNTLGTALGIALVHSASVWWRPRSTSRRYPRPRRRVGRDVCPRSDWNPARPLVPRRYLLWRMDSAFRSSRVVWGPCPAGLGRRARDTVRRHRELVAGAPATPRRRRDPRACRCRPASSGTRSLVHDSRPASARDSAPGHRRGRHRSTGIERAAIASRLLAPEVRARDALRRIAWRDTLSIVVRPTNSGYCVRVNATEHCGLGYTIGSGWALLLGGQPVSPGFYLLSVSSGWAPSSSQSVGGRGSVGPSRWPPCSHWPV
jgi:hypothetical protein